MTPADVEALATALEAASWRGVHALEQVLSAAAAVHLLEALTQLLKAEPTLVEARTYGLILLSLVGGAKRRRWRTRCRRSPRSLSHALMPWSGTSVLVGGMVSAFCVLVDEVKLLLGACGSCAPATVILNWRARL